MQTRGILDAPASHCSPKTQSGADSNPHFSERSVHSSASMRALNENGQASHLWILLAVLGPRAQRHFCPPGGSTALCGSGPLGGVKSGETYSSRRERSPWKARGGMHWRAL